MITAPHPARYRLNRRTLLAAGVAALAAPARGAAPARQIDHAFGRTVIAGPPVRVVSLGYTTHDTLLALGIVPVALRHWYGTSESGVWPWAEPLLNGARPEVLRGEIPMERVAALRPDLVVALGSGITQAEYAVLDRIAPTLAQPAGAAAFGTPWDATLQIIGQATWRETQAQALIDGLRARLAAVRAANPVWRGKTAVAAYHWAGTTGAFLPGDARSDSLESLGFALPPAIRALARPGEFYLDLSPDDLSPLESDVLVWVSAFDAAPDLAALPMRRTLASHRAGREVFAGPLTGAAMSHASVLSLPWAIDALQAELSAAIDGRPATRVATAVAAGLAP